MKYLYIILGYLADQILPIAGLFHRGARSWINGRKSQTYPENLNHPIWIHCASLGEFEQGRPLIEAIKTEWPEQHIILTFFSSSGYNIRKNYELADWVGYMPMDTLPKAKSFVNKTRPKMALFVKYEFWYCHIAALIEQDIPYFFISSVWTDSHYLLKWYYRWLLKQVFNARVIFVQDQASKQKLTWLGYLHVIVAGDTRIDRVVAIARNNLKIEEFENLDTKKPILVAGSTWPADDQLLLQFLELVDTHSLIIVPHEPIESEINRLLKAFDRYQPMRYSTWIQNDFKVLILDKIGMLNKLYAYAEVAYIGGGFGRGIHNTLEAAVYGIPVFFGPHYEQFNEAKSMITIGIAFCVEDAQTMALKWKNIIPDKVQDIKNQSGRYFSENAGATATIIDYLRPLIQQPK